MTAFRDSPWSAVLVMLLGVMATLAIPKWVDDFALIQITIYVVMAMVLMVRPEGLFQRIQARKI